MLSKSPGEILCLRAISYAGVKENGSRRRPDSPLSSRSHLRPDGPSFYRLYLCVFSLVFFSALIKLVDYERRSLDRTPMVFVFNYCKSGAVEYIWCIILKIEINWTEYRKISATSRFRRRASFTKINFVCYGGIVRPARFSASISELFDLGKKALEELAITSFSRWLNFN